MTTDDPVVTGLIALIADLETELDSAERRIARAQDARTIAAGRLAAARDTLQVYCAKHGVALPDSTLSDDVRARWSRLSPKDMIIEYARSQGGKMTVAVAAQILSKAGLFADTRNASANIYAIIGRNPDWFTKIHRGEYALIEHPQLPLGEAAPVVLPLRPHIDQRELVAQA